MSLDSSQSLNRLDSTLTTDLSNAKSGLRVDANQLDTRSALSGSSSIASAQPQALSTNTAIDLVWRNTATGGNRIWSIDSSGAIDPKALITVPDQNWQIVASGDFSHNGQESLLWRNFATGQLALWQVDGSSVQTAYLSINVKDLNWRVVGVDDFNQDGSSDILWQNTNSGEVAIWTLNGSTISSSPIIGSIAGSGWQLQGTGNFNGDRAPDLIWNNTTTGQTTVWLLKGTQILQKVSLDSPSSPDWKIAGIGNYDDTGNTDLLWRNNRTGETSFWLYNGTTKSQANSSITVPSNWTPVQTGDFDGTAGGASRLIWRDATSGAVADWTISNGNIAKSPIVATEPDLNWKLVGAFTTTASASTATPLPAGTTGGSTIATAATVNPAFSLSDSVNVANPSDFYRFSIAQSGVFTANLTGLTGDADVRLIQDTNGNGAIDTGEVLAWQWERGTTSESIRRFINAGTYYVQVLSYNNQAANFSLNTNFSASATDPQKFQIAINFDSTLGGLSQAARDAVNQAARFWEGVITGRSSITQSNTLNVTLDGQNLVYQDGTPDTSTLALSGPTLTVDGSNNLVITKGASTLNLRDLSQFNSNPSYLQTIMTHELAHVFGFGTIWQPITFNRTDGTSFSAGKTLIDRTSSTYLANTYAGWAYGDLLGTRTPTAVPIEPQIFAHWDETRFGSELLTPYAEAPGAPSPLSSLTLAALRDLGWNINMGAAQPYSLPTVARSTAASTSSNQPALAVAAYKCSCPACRAAARTELLSPNLSEVISA